ncbi:chromate transporter [Peribacillus deserti]|uniref:Chromate transporter n=1 Tax=Peribacillus deserti TaxID=673318 RepID=A0ABS2QN16_9BACI|nr:chromate efflux transporter [Peribacillus deserti]MBM7694114.1 chromate transporter [Peribacillus deserti]
MNHIKWRSLLEILLVSTRLGLTSFGGPIAHIGYFHEEYVRRRKWLDERSYADLVALCQFLPGPASSQVGIGIGVIRGGVLGGIFAFIGFTLPSVIALILFAYMLKDLEFTDAGWIHGLKIVAVVVVAHAIMGMAQKLTPRLTGKSIALFALIAVLLSQTAFTQVGVILLSGLIGYFVFTTKQKETESIQTTVPVSRKLGLYCLILFAGLLMVLPILKGTFPASWISLFDSFYRSGSLVFGGGHVVLPLLEREFVPVGWLDKESFLAGYGATQAVPGPLFTFAAYIGAVIGGWQAGLLAAFAIFLPAFLLVLGALPFWQSMRLNSKIRGALTGVNAAVVGILLAAFYHPIWTSSILTSIDFAFAAVLFSMLAFWKLPSWVIVLVGAIGGWALALF